MVSTSSFRNSQSVKSLPKIAVLSDAHGNVEALIEAFNIAKKNGAESYVYLGDCIGYIPSIEALEFLKQSEEEIVFLKGNHEEAIVHFDHRTEYDEITKHFLIRQLLTDSDATFIKKWKEKHYLEYAVGRILFLHGSPDDPLNGYVYPDSDFSSIDSSPDFNILFTANTHIPFLRKSANTIVVNVGSVGLPRDHGKLGSFALIDFEEKRIEIIRFSIAETQKNLRKRYNELIDSRVYEVFDRVISDTNIEELRFD